MNLVIDYQAITDLFKKARRADRSFLYEYEVYSLLAQSGAETPPSTFLVHAGSKIADEDMLRFPGDKVVLKIVSPTIIHKTEVGGVKVVDNQPNAIRSAIRRMSYEVVQNYAAWLVQYSDQRPPEYRGLDGDDLVEAISRDIQGVLVVQYMPPDSEAFGNELIVSLRATREFGMVITAGLGGTDTELYAERFRKGQAVVSGSTQMHDGESFFRLFRQTIAYEKLAGLTRGQRRIVTDEQLIECFESFIHLGNYYAPANDAAEFTIEELEINPFAFTDYLMVPLDGMCRFQTTETLEVRRSAAAIEQLLHPGRIGLIGVSARRRNFGSIILENILAEGFDPGQICIIHETEQEIAGVSCVKALAELTSPVDLLIVAVGATHIPGLIEDLNRTGNARSVMIISAGIGETSESEDLAGRITGLIREGHTQPGGGPLYLGANCMGVVSRPGGYDTWFIPKEKFAVEKAGTYHRAALISQSGAFMLTRSSQCPQLDPAYMISMGNQTDLTLGDMLEYFSMSDQVDVVGVYAEGFRDLDGIHFCQALRKAVLAGKEVIFYKAGRTPEGKAATSSHTASLAGDYMVCESCVRQAGGMVARSLTEFQELLFLAEILGKKQVGGNRLAALSGAGFEAVGMADSITSEDFKMELAVFSTDTVNRISEVLKRNMLDSLVTVVNPLDINPAADDLTHAQIGEVLLDDPGVDGVVMSLDPLSPAMRTLADTGSAHFDMESENSIKQLAADLAIASVKPLVVVVDGGRKFDPLRDALIDCGIGVFAVCDRAVAVLSLYMQGRLASAAIRSVQRESEH